ncbi:hypothetical protein PPL_12442 [Heterostelium album PN500]|uniref:Uncharacterized protein n=1 Tax=Heterostelium pallidum (strain ATCC 26659 / Pp 5 / PN500) TaxID=670386 RepID=D3BMM0_HETP5|nr:hypothetical protein PPL_12442 [Heterostelium album PN500]EFA77232.1 hypothetical protein PPL_12442 [Heterostelium album PN500]|eukprot:XP_020429361.1 hypothetical protein PPL_12442 [Heterostelium album PN500]
MSFRKEVKTMMFMGVLWPKLCICLRQSKQKQDIGSLQQKREKTLLMIYFKNVLILTYLISSASSSSSSYFMLFSLKMNKLTISFMVNEDNISPSLSNSTFVSKSKKSVDSHQSSYKRSPTMVSSLYTGNAPPPIKLTTNDKQTTIHSNSSTSSSSGSSSSSASASYKTNTNKYYEYQRYSQYQRMYQQPAQQQQPLSPKSQSPRSPRSPPSQISTQQQLNHHPSSYHPYSKFNSQYPVYSSMEQHYQHQQQLYNQYSGIVPPTSHPYQHQYDNYYGYIY